MPKSDIPELRAIRRLDENREENIDTKSDIPSVSRSVDQGVAPPSSGAGHLDTLSVTDLVYTVRERPGPWYKGCCFRPSHEKVILNKVTLQAKAGYLTAILGNSGKIVKDGYLTAILGNSGKIVKNGYLTAIPGNSGKIVKNGYLTAILGNLGKIVKNGYLAAILGNSGKIVKDGYLTAILGNSCKIVKYWISHRYTGKFR